MKFQKGDLVWHGWHTDVGIDRRFMQGEVIDDMPHPHPIYGTPARWVKWQDGKVVGAEEHLLLKVPPEERGRTEEKEDQKPVETV